MRVRPMRETMSPAHCPQVAVMANRLPRCFPSVVGARASNSGGATNSRALGAAPATRGHFQAQENFATRPHGFCRLCGAGTPQPGSAAGHAHVTPNRRLPGPPVDDEVVALGLARNCLVDGAPE